MPKPSPKARTLLRYLLLAALAYGLYLTDVERRSALGRAAITATGLQSVTLEEALPLATEQGKPILVEVSAVWCPTCRAVDRRVLADPDVNRRIREDHVFVRLEYESPAAEAFMRAQGARGYPMFFLLDADGSSARRLAMTMDPRAFAAQLAP